MKFAALIPLTAAALNFVLALFVLTRGLQGSVNRIYMLWGSSLTVWNIGVFFLFTIDDPDAALFWARFVQFGVVFLPISLLHLCVHVAGLPVPRWLIRAMYAFQISLAVCDFTSLFVAGVRYTGYAYYAIGGPAFWVFVASYTVLTSGTLVMLYWKLKTLPPLHGARVRSLFWAVAILILFGTNDLLPILGFYQYPMTELPIYPLGSLAAIFFGVLVGYSVLQHELLDVHMALSRIAAHAIRLSFLLLIGLVLLTLMAMAMPPRFNFNPVSFSAALVALIMSAFIASIYFPRLFGSGLEMLERRITGDRFEYHDKIRSFIQSMQWYENADLLLKDVDDLLVKTVRVKAYQIILLDEHTHMFTLFRAHPEELMRELPELRTDSATFRFFNENKVEFLAFNIAYAPPGQRRLEEEARDELAEFGAEFCFPFQFEHEPFGLLMIGEKLSKDLYTSTDISLLESLAKNLSIMINQIRLKNQIMQAQEMELLGRMSRGMAHDLNNLLTPIWTLLQLASEGVSTQDLNEDLLPVALRNLKAVRSYIRESLFFSQNLRPDFQLGRLDVLIKQVVELVDDRRESKDIKVTVDTPGEVLVEMDEVLIQRLLGNLVSNAIDASPEGATIRIELVRLLKTELSRDWLRVRVIDNGEGIRPEDLERVTTPYFTTKNRGDGTRGFGLGLAISRRIVQLHNGNLNISSEWKKGTTVQVDIPSRQNAPAKPFMVESVQ
jgi:signal transduction histidine kinase